MEKQEAYFRTMQVTLAKNFERDKENLIAEQRKRDEETNAMLRQTQLRFQVRFRRKTCILYYIANYVCVCVCVFCVVLCIWDEH